MLLQAYTPDELKFAYCCHVYFRWHTRWRTPHAGLARITSESIEKQRADIHVLNIESSDTDLALLASLRPSDSVSTGASKLKGAVSKIARQNIPNQGPDRILGKGYFACTVGPRTSDELDRYLETQSAHHGYRRHTSPPTFVRTWPDDGASKDKLRGTRSSSTVRWHLVFSTWNRKGAFSSEAAESVVDHWQSCMQHQALQFIKVSFLPDHVHLAIRTHPAVVPAELVPLFLNSSQDLIRNEFERMVISTGSPRLWKPSAYIGTYGDLSNKQIQAYLRAWQSRNT